MDKLKMHSPNLTEENITKLASLFPNCVTESKDKTGTLKKSIDFDLLKQELSTHIVEGPQERYHLNWPGKREALLTANAPIAKTLRPCREESVDFDTTQNLFIEGDNLDALKLLQETYLGKVKMIYIDPPYNTGNDFIYADNFAESTDEYLLESGQKDDQGNRLVANTESNGRFHSDWLSMMYPRLKLARNLLKDDGVIFISIDDNEVDNLKKIGEEIFGSQNFISTIIWQKVYSPKNSAKHFSGDHDYILVFAKNAMIWKPNLLPRTEASLARYQNPDNDSRGKWKKSDLTARNYYGAGQYEVESPSGKKFTSGKGTYWRLSKENFQKLDQDKSIWWGEDSNSMPQQKRFLSDVQNGMVPQTFWPYTEVGHTQEAKKELLKYVNFEKTENVLNSVKPTRLIERIIHISTNSSSEDIILDFFAGSGSTGMAVLKKNIENKGNRKFVLVQIPEKLPIEENEVKTICDLCRSRLINYGKELKEKNHQIDSGFRVLKVDSGNMADVYYTPDAISQDGLFNLTDNIKPDRCEEDLLFQVLLDWGVDLTLPITRETIENNEVYFVDGNALAACFVKKGRITEAFCKELAKRQPLRVVFRDAGFKDDSVKINVEQIFKLMSPHTDVRTI